MRTIEEINEKIKKGKVVVVTAQEMVKIAKEKGVKGAYETVDVVTTGTFGPMCSSGMFINLGHSKPRIKIGGGRCYLNDVPAYCGLAAVDIYIGATALPDDDPRNRVYPGTFEYGGGHVIEDFISGKNIKLTAFAYGTDCYPRKKIETYINKYTVNEAYLFNPRNAYQNYNVAVNLSNRIIYTYMGTLKPNLGNANYCSAGELSPLLKDPYFRTIGIGTRIFLCGAKGYIAWYGTQFNPSVPRSESGIPKRGGGTIATIGNAKEMDPAFVKGASFLGYGTTLFVGIGIPIPIIDEEMAFFTSRSDEEIFAPVVDYGKAYPERSPEVLGEVRYSDLKKGKIIVMGREVSAFPISSFPKAKIICETLKEWIKNGQFFLTKPLEPFPKAEEVKVNNLEERTLEEV